MTQDKKIELLEDMLDLDAGALSPDTVLADLSEWDSLAALSLIVLVDEEFGKKLSGAEIKAFTTVQDILDFMG